MAVCALKWNLGGPNDSKQITAAATKLTVTVANMAMHMASDSTRDHARNTPYPASSHAYQTMATTPSHARGAIVLRENPAVSH